MSLWQAIAVGVLSLLGSYLVARVTSRSADRATDKTVEAQKHATSSEDLRHLADKLEHRLDKVEEDLDEARARIAALESELQRERQESYQLRMLVGALVEYCRLLRRTLRVYAVEIPQPPDILDEHL